MHFVAVCDRYPSFTFNVPALRSVYDQAGRTRESALVRFHNRVLDTQAAGFSAPEAALIKAALESMRAYPPLFGADIRLQEVPADTPTGSTGLTTGGSTGLTTGKKFVNRPKETDL